MFSKPHNQLLKFLILQREVGAQDLGVDEPPAEPLFDIVALHARLPLEFDLVAEPMELTGLDLTILTTKHGSAKEVARHIGVSEAFVRQTVQKAKQRPCAQAEY